MPSSHTIIVMLEGIHNGSFVRRSQRDCVLVNNDGRLSDVLRD